MSYQYDQYLTNHKFNVEQGFDWIRNHLPELLVDEFGYEWQIRFAHDRSKYDPEEYDAYDAYFYGGNRSYEVVQKFRYAWLRHIHKNPHHWQHWILINDDPDEGEILLEIPYNYIIEMICDWWSFSWASGDLFSIFAWYAEHKDYIRMNPDSRKTVEDILEKIRDKLEEEDNNQQTYLRHYGVKGMKWGVRNGPPYPLDKSRSHDNIVEKAIASGTVLKDINRDKQMKHTKSWHTPGRSYLDGDFEFAQRLVDEYSGNGEPIMDKKGNWTNKERFTADDIIGTHVNRDRTETRTNKGVIAYSKTGTHVYPRKEK